MSQVLARDGMLAAVVILTGVVASILPSFADIEEALGLAALFSVRGPVEAPSEVAIIAVSGESAAALGVSRHVGEWPRELHAALIERLRTAGARVIAFDIIFETARESEPEGDERLAAAIAAAGNVVLAERVTEITQPFILGERRVRPIEPFRSAALGTAPFMLPLVPARVGQSWTFGRADGTPSLPAVSLHAYALSAHERLIAMLYEARPALDEELTAVDAAAVRRDGLHEVMRRLRSMFLADSATLAADLKRRLELEDDSAEHRLLRAMLELLAGGNSRYLNFYGPAGTIDTVPFHHVLEAEPHVLQERFNGRAVFVGFFEQRRSEQQDYFDSVFSERSGQRLAGVEIGATAFANLLRRESIRPIALLGQWAILTVWGLLVAVLALRMRGFGAAAAVFAAGVMYFAAAQHLFEAYRLWVPLVTPLGLQAPLALVAGLAWNHAVLRRQRERIQAALGYYVPPRIVARLAVESASPQGNREIVYGTCLVTDAQQYTTLSEILDPAELGELMDAYYEVLVDAVHREGGVVSDIGGDSMVAVWPAAHTIEAARTAANRAAVGALAAVDAFNQSRLPRKLPTRIGLDAGELLLGNVGASARGEYRAVGDIVNTAARLQSLNSVLGTRILVSRAAAPDTPEFHYRPLGDFLLVGKRTPVSVLELRAVNGLQGTLAHESDDPFPRALALFRSQRWAEAEAAFSAIVQRAPDDGAALFFARECKILGRRYPGGEGWDGVVRIATK